MVIAFLVFEEGHDKYPADEPDGKNYVDLRQIPCLNELTFARWLYANVIR